MGPCPSRMEGITRSLKQVLCRCIHEYTVYTRVYSHALFGISVIAYVLQKSYATFAFLKKLFHDTRFPCYSFACRFCFIVHVALSYKFSLLFNVSNPLKYPILRNNTSGKILHPSSSTWSKKSWADGMSTYRMSNVCLKIFKLLLKHEKAEISFICMV